MSVKTHKLTCTQNDKMKAIVLHGKTIAFTLSFDSFHTLKR